MGECDNNPDYMNIYCAKVKHGVNHRIESNFLILISKQPDSGNLWYFKLKLVYPTEWIVWKL